MGTYSTYAVSVQKKAVNIALSHNLRSKREDGTNSAIGRARDNRSKSRNLPTLLA